MSLLSAHSACSKLKHPLTLEICFFFHVPCSVKGPAHLPSHWPLLPYPRSQYFPLLFSPFPFKVLNVPDLGYLKSLLNFLPSSSLCTSIVCVVAWLIFLRHCFVMPIPAREFLVAFHHSQRVRPMCLSLSQDIPSPCSNLIQYIFSTYFSTAPFHVPHFAAKQLFFFAITHHYVINT